MNLREKTRWGAVAAAVLITVAVVTPAFAVGALMVPITGSLGISAATFGLCLSGFFAFTAIGSPLSARLAENIGAAPQLAAAALAAGAVMVGLGFVSSVAALAALLTAGGLVNSLVAPAAGLILGAEVSPKRLSLASGMVQAALATPPLTAGLLVRLLAEPHGWRIALSMGGVLVALSSCVAVLARREKEAGYSLRSTAGSEATSLNAVTETAGSRVLLLWSAGSALGTVGVTATASFFVPIALGAEFTVATAGLFALAAGTLAAFVRVAAGMLADRRPRNNVAAVICMMVAGSVGLATMSFGTTTAFLVGALLVVVGLWGWNGLMVASAIRLLPGRPARAIGGLQVGFFLGATAAPLLFGISSTVVGIKGALLTMAAIAVAGAGVIAAGELYRRYWERRFTSRVACSQNKS